MFTELAPTQEMLYEFLTELGFQVVCLNGSMDMEEHKRAQDVFAKGFFRAGRRNSRRSWRHHSRGTSRPSRPNQLEGSMSPPADQRYRQIGLDRLFALSGLKERRILPYCETRHPP